MEKKMANDEIKLQIEEKDQEKGASLVEYALLVALIAVVAIAAVTLVGTSISTSFSGIASGLQSAGQ
jgi:pilus assembly protein Flp/PilA